jgi:hypothetical protein
MRLVSSTTGRLAFVVSFIIISINLSAQVNSPYSRYGIGDLNGSHHIISRGMGGIRAAYADGLSNNVGQSVNFGNPATYGSFYMISYDLALLVDSRTLVSKVPDGKDNSIYFIPNYIAIGMPLKKSKGLGLAFGIKPVSKINYQVITRERAAGDSIGTVYDGNGGLNQAFVGIGKRWKNLQIGLNTGYAFGSKETKTIKTFLNDTVSYSQSSSSTKTNFGNVFLHLGLQYEFSVYKKVNKITKSTQNYLLRFGATSTLQQSLNATQDINKETFALNSVGASIGIDTVFKQQNIRGTVVLPASYEAGFVLHKTLSNTSGLFELWSVGVEYSSTQWKNYRFYGQPDALNNSWMVKIGGQISPNPLAQRNYLNNVNYRVGFNFGQDYVNADGKGLKTMSASFGAGFPIRKWRAYETQYTVLQTSFQIGKRGSGTNNITENFLQFTFGLSLNDNWFIKRKYD